MMLAGAVIASLAGLAIALPHGKVKRQVSQLRPQYDFIIAGGGTAGLTVADRLTEAFPDKTVLVVEYGEIEYAAGLWDPPSTVWGGQGFLASYFSFQSLPTPHVNNRTAIVLAGKVVGGSSAVNAQFFDRPSRYDLDAWAAAATGSDGKNKNGWNWDGVFPFFKKSVTFTPPPAEVAQQYGYTWDESAYGNTTPIHASFPPYQWADYYLGRNAFTQAGVRTRQECAGGDKDGLCWVPTSQHPVTARRSYAGLGHYADVNLTRPNYDLLVNHQVTRVLYPNGNTRSGPPRVEIRSLSNNTFFNVTAKAEVILSAGTFHTPAILQRSGIGHAPVLRAAGIPVVLDLPGVGSNLQDHSGSGISWNYTKPGNFTPMPSDMLSSPAFLADAVAGFNSVPAYGPYTLANPNSAIFVPLPNITANYTSIVDKLRTMAAADGNGTVAAASYLPDDYRSDPRMVAGYQKQLRIIADLLANPRAPSQETTFQTGTALRAINLHPVSRGTVRLNLTDLLAQPVLVYGTGSNPVDFDVYLAQSRFLRGMVKTEALQAYGAVEVTPGEGVQSDEELLEYVKSGLVHSFMHPCCTAAMMPREEGGVVGGDLKVHGAKGLRVVDMSVLPVLPSSHLSALAYAVGEKAADIIIREWR